MAFSQKNGNAVIFGFVLSSEINSLHIQFSWLFSHSKEKTYVLFSYQFTHQVELSLLTVFNILALHLFDFKINGVWKPDLVSVVTVCMVYFCAFTL